MATAARPMTAEEFLALPDVEGVDRELIRGELWEGPLTTRALPHSYVMSNFSYHFKDWILRQPPPHGFVVSGECRILLRRDPGTIVGVDVAYVAPEHAARTAPDAAIVDGAPCLVVEISSSSDTKRGMTKKVREYLAAGVRQVWIADPDFKTVVIHRPEAEPVLFNADQTIPGDPDLPGLALPVARIFAR